MLDDPYIDRLTCVGQNHVPGCEHFPPFAEPDLGYVPMRDHEEPVGLTIELTVSVARRGRKRCPRCHKLRQLLSLSAFANDQPVGYGRARCLECASLRIVTVPRGA